MKLVMTACLRNESDIVRIFIQYHLAQGVDHIIVHDTGSDDHTLEVLAELERDERLTVIRTCERTFDQATLVTDLARRAYWDHEAEWVINSDVDEFWWPSCGDLKAALASVPDEFAVAKVMLTNFLPSHDEVGRWWERLTIRDLRGVNKFGRAIHPKVCHRGSPSVRVDHASLRVTGPGTDAIYTHPSLEILHFPLRSRRQYEAKVLNGARAVDEAAASPLVATTWRRLAAMAAEGELSELIHAEADRGARYASGTRHGIVARDHRLMMYLRKLERKGVLGRQDVAVIIPVRGRQELTHRVLSDLNADDFPCTISIIDNGGDYRRRSDENVLTPATNLHWAGGCNLGLLTAQEQGHPAYVLLNNDVRLSRGFIEGLVAAWRETRAGLIGPVYDRNWPQQRVHFNGPAASYAPAPTERTVPFLDGTCLLVPHATLRAVGLFDQHTWPAYGWGCDKDYALRVRLTGQRVVATQRSYLNHLGRKTGTMNPEFSEVEAEEENDAGMVRKWGPAWRDVLYGSSRINRLGLVQMRIAAGTPRARGT